MAMSFEGGNISHTPKPEKGSESGTISEKGLKDLDTVATAFQQRADLQLHKAVEHFNTAHPGEHLTFDYLKEMSSKERNAIMMEFIQGGMAEKFADEQDAHEPEVEQMEIESADDLGDVVRGISKGNDTVH
jgi:hypothetical protein